MVLFLQEWVPIELYHLISDTVCAQEVSDGLRDQNDDLAVGSATAIPGGVICLP